MSTEQRLAKLREAVEYEIKVARKQIELLKLRSSESPAAANAIRPFGSAFWKLLQRLEAALDQPAPESATPDSLPRGGSKKYE